MSMNDNEVTYQHELIDFPDVEELRSITTPKEEIFKAKKRSFLMSIGGDLVAKAKNQGETKYSATLADNFLGLNQQDQKRMAAEVTDFLTKHGLNVTWVESESTDPNDFTKNIVNRTIKIDWSI